eukprot:comp19448_c0_seq1/m.22603 comp19448_c0_seq1/g.22603  ORF comp19448_c0_seq1/g.22603 comp19448_c0_seq1/m.22603 type:complete len:272 (-) comp19448_c0_seq1:5-820(-)
MDASEVLEAAKHGDLEKVLLHLDRRGSADICEPAFHTSALHYASKYGHSSIVSLLLSRGANPSAANRAGSTPLHYAAQGGSVDVVSLLASAGSLVSVRNIHFGASPLHVAAAEGNTDICKVLLRAGADMLTRENAGYTAVDVAVINNHPEVAITLGEWHYAMTHPWTPKTHTRFPLELQRQVHAIYSMRACGPDGPLHSQAHWWKLPWEVVERIVCFLGKIQYGDLIHRQTHQHQLAALHQRPPDPPAAPLHPPQTPTHVPAAGSAPVTPD